jgi:hypothetical protein
MWRGTGSLMGSLENSKQADQAIPQIEGNIDSNGANNSTPILSNPFINQSIQNDILRISDRYHRTIGRGLERARFDTLAITIELASPQSVIKACWAVRNFML